MFRDPERNVSGANSSKTQLDIHMYSHNVEPESKASEAGTAARLIDESGDAYDVAPVGDLGRPIRGCGAIPGTASKPPGSIGLLCADWAGNLSRYIESERAAWDLRSSPATILVVHRADTAAEPPRTAF